MGRASTLRKSLNNAKGENKNEKGIIFYNNLTIILKEDIL